MTATIFGSPTAVRPGQRSARIIDTLQHREIDIFGGADPLVHGIRRLVDEHGDGAHHDEAGCVVDHRHLLAQGLEEAGGGAR